MSNSSDTDNEKDEEKIFIGKKRSKCKRKLSLTKYRFENIKIEKQPTRKSKNYIDLSSKKEKK